MKLHRDGNKKQCLFLISYQKRYYFISGKYLLFFFIPIVDSYNLFDSMQQVLTLSAGWRN